MNYQERKCKNCGGGKFINQSWGIECWYCGSEYEKERNTPEPPHIGYLPFSFNATYFASPASYSYPEESWGWNTLIMERGDRYWP